MRALTLANALSLANAGTLGPFDTTATNGGGSAPAVFTTVGYTATVNDIVKLGGTPPTGFTAGTSYHVVSPSTDTYELSATQGGSAINGTGTGTSITATIYPAAGGTGSSTPVDLLDSDSVTTDPYIQEFVSGGGTYTEASPAVFTWGAGAGFIFADGDPAVIVDGTVSTDFTLDTLYYVINSNSGAGTFELAATSGGDPIDAGAGTGSNLLIFVTHNSGGDGVTNSPGAPFLPDYSGALAVYLSSDIANVTVYVEGADALADGSAGSYDYALNGAGGQTVAGSTLFAVLSWPQWIRVRYVNAGGVGVGTAQVSALGVG
jgi:hypothetical protein